jgi:hypothetical protein
VEPHMVRVGNLFLNVSTVLWAEIRNSPETSSPILSLIYGNAEGNQRFILQINAPDSEKVIHYLESNSQDLRY